MAGNKRKKQKLEKAKTNRRSTKQTKRLSGKSCNVKNDPCTSKQAAVKNLEEKKWHQQDDQRLLLIFPEELWCMILDKLKISTDLENWSNASPYFRQLLLPRRIHFLFSKMFQILAPRIGNDMDNNDCSASNEGTLDADSDLPWYHVIIGLRLVCSSWQHGVDQYYNNHWLHYQMQHDPYDQNLHHSENPATIEKLTERFTFKARLGGVVGIYKFLQRFKNTHTRERNPFFGRTLILDNDTNGRHPVNAMIRIWQQRHVATDFDKALVRLLNKYGNHVWHMVIQIEDNYSSRVTYIRQLRNWLVMMPNLKTLHIKYITDINFTSDNVRQQMETELNTGRFPKLHALKFLKCKGLPAPIFNNLIRVNNHVVKLEVDKESIHKGYNLAAAQLHNLTELAWTICSNVDFDTLEVANLNWKQLNKLYLPYKPSTETFLVFNFAEWLKVFDFCNNKLASSSKLTDLMIELPELTTATKDNLKELDCLKLSLPNVKRFKVCMGSRSSRCYGFTFMLML